MVDHPSDCKPPKRPISPETAYLQVPPTHVAGLHETVPHKAPLPVACTFSMASRKISILLNNIRICMVCAVALRGSAWPCVALSHAFKTILPLRLGRLHRLGVALMLLCRYHELMRSIRNAMP
jgi:hypothetical protein